MKDKVNIIFVSQGSDNNEHLKMVSLAPFLLKSYVDYHITKEFHNIINTKVINFDFNDSVNQMVSQILDRDVDALVFSVYVWNYADLLESARIIKEKKSNIKIIFGGPQIAPIANEEMKKNQQIDIATYLRLDGEIVIYELIKALIKKESLNHIKGIIYRDSSGSLIKTDYPGKELDYSEIPSPYINGDVKFENNKNHAILESYRGCPYKCSFCSWNGESRGVRYFSLERVLKEIEVVYNNPNVTCVSFADSDLFNNLKRSEKIIEFIIVQNVRKIKTNFEMNINHFNKGILKKVSLLPGINFQFAIQTTNANALKYLNRPWASKSIFIEKFALLKKITPDAKVIMDIMLGLPGDTFEGFKETMNFALSFEPSQIMLSYPVYLLPGSYFFENKDNLGLRYLPNSPFSIIETISFKKSEIREAYKMMVWIEIFTHYYPAIAKFFYQISRLDKSQTRVQRIEKWAQEAERRIKLFSCCEEDFIDIILASVKGRNYIKKKLLVNASSYISAYKIYSAIYDLEHDTYGNYMQNTIQLGLKVFEKALKHNNNNDKEFDFNQGGINAEHCEIDLRDIYSTVKV